MLNTFRPMSLLRRAAGMRPGDDLPVLPEGPTTPAVHPSRASPMEVPTPIFAELARRAALGQGGAAQHADDKSTDVAAYAARALANGRDVDLAGEGRNTADDGTAFWGPVDNGSSRAKAGGQVLTIDQWECITCGTCEENTTLVFEVPSDDKARVLAQDGPMDLIQDAIEACPVTCIHWIEVEEVASHHSCGGHDST